MEMIAKDRLEAEDVRDMCERLLRDHLSFETEGYKISTGMALNVLLTAAVEKRSIEAVCGDLVAVVDSNTLREALNRALTVDDLRQHEAEFNAALVECSPRQMPRAGLEMAIDFHDEPYYGKSEAMQAYTCRGEAHDGTTYFWRIASLYIMWRQVRLTLALTYVLPQESTLSIVDRLLKRRESLGIGCKVLYLDKGFCSGDIIAYLQDITQPALIACPIRGKKGRGGTRALCTGRKAYRHTFTDGTTADLAVVPTLTRDKKTGKQRRTWLGRPAKLTSAITAASALNPRTVNWARSGRLPIRATSPCASSISPWLSCYSIFGPFCAVPVPASLPLARFAWS